MTTPTEKAGQTQDPAATAADNPTSTGSVPKTLAAVLGEIVWLMTRSPNHRYFFIGDMEWMILQPVTLGQFRIFHGEKHPVGVVFWAQVDEAVEQRLQQGITRLSPPDWKSGDRLWLVDAVTPFGNVQPMLADLARNVFPGKTFKYLQRDTEGRLQVKESGRSATGTAAAPSPDSD